MNPAHLPLLACPRCQGSLQLAGEVQEGRVREGTLTCTGCRAPFPIVGGIPRFVPRKSYADSFGFEWNVHSRTQYDSHLRADVSGKRFFEETKWPRDMKGQTVLEAGGGAGRFTEQVAATGATIVSVDLSRAVEANYKSNGHRENVCIVQGNIYALPAKRGAFDRVFCLGVLQHTPDVRKSFLALRPHLKPGGHLAIDVYRKFPWWFRLIETRFWIRPVTKRLRPELLYRLVKSYIDAMWPIAKVVNKLPRGTSLNWLMFIADYRGKLPLDERSLKQWAYLDTFDSLSPAYDQPQFLETVQDWFREGGLVDIEVNYGHNGIEGRGRAP